MRRAATLGVAVLAVALLAGCDGDDAPAGNGDAAPTTTSPPGATTTSVGGATPDGACEEAAGEGFGLDAREGERSVPRVVLLADVVVAGGGCVDTVTFEFEDGVPSWRVGEAMPPFQEDASGRPLDVAGQAFVEVVLEGASGVDLSGESPRQAYEGPAEIRPEGTSTVVEVQRAGDFEAMMRWIVGLDARHPFSVTVEDGALVVSVVDVAA